ncbi:hypothetical protein DH2020_031550 [Rehmannia glutinosa]|uniref:Peptide N-acetyl-beta-D-glucosaminyl asparaginase amidase A N-terminal domain-containing protein n=1 Tax=Rehmannia glutinosa TaxID=99300 RepID=A0ABR0VHP6_REHGL
MASSFFPLLLLLSTLTLLHQPPLSAANLHTTTALFRSQPISEPTSLFAAETLPTTFFEVTKPIPLPKTKPCSYLVLKHDFAYTYGKSPVLADYKPPSDCPSRNFAKIVLEWTATCKGRQFDRIFGVWLGGVEILRSCTAEPRATGIVWTVKKDITRYYSLLMSNQTLAVYLGNLVDSTYTGVYHVNVTIHFYPAEASYGHSEVDHGELENGADLILPISRNLPLNDGLWFEIENSTDVESKEFKIPQNVYRAVLEVYVSFHENDEFWFGNYPNEYIAANNLTGSPEMGRLEKLSLAWTICVRNALNVWYIDANLHLWLDKKSEKTQGKLLEYSDSPLSLSILSNFTGFDGLFVTNVSRTIISSGWVKSSHGVVTTKSIQGFKYSNSMIMGNDGNLQILNQIITLNSSVATKTPSSSVRSSNSHKKFSLYLHSDAIDKGDGSYDSVANVTLGFNEKRLKTSDLGKFTSKLNNLQNAQGDMFVKGNLVVSGLGSTQQEYQYTSDKSLNELDSVDILSSLSHQNFVGHKTWSLNEALQATVSSFTDAYEAVLAEQMDATLELGLLLKLQNSYIWTHIQLKFLHYSPLIVLH